MAVLTPALVPKALITRWIVVALSSVLLAACSATAGTDSVGQPTSTAVATSSVFGKRYCEVLLVHGGPGAPTATVYNTYPLNDCPDSEWAALNARTVAAQQHATVAILNGPRYWAMDRIEKKRRGKEVVEHFGGMAMIEEATVTQAVGTATPYTPHSVDRSTVWVYNAGRQVYELVAPGGDRWVMQSWSQIVDPTLSLADLPTVADRLHVPAGWRYQVRTLAGPLRIDTTTHPARVIQDGLGNTYSLESSTP